MSQINPAKNSALGCGKQKKKFSYILRRDFQKHWQLYLIMLPVLAWYLTFCYGPLYGILAAFQRYNVRKGIAGSTWIGLKNFKDFFGSYYFGRVLGNTLKLNLADLIFAWPTSILFAILLNEIGHSGFKRTVQTITYMPYFISMVVMCSLIKIYSREDGLFTQIVVLFGGQRQNLLINPAAFRPIYIISGIWQGIGWNSIIYLAALSGIDQEQYEAARIDGANRFKQMVHITLPGILPTIMILLILRMGSILNVGYEKVILLYTNNTYSVADVISTYTYRKGITDSPPQYSYSTAVGLFNTIVNVAFLLVTNFISTKTTESGLF